MTKEELIKLFDKNKEDVSKYEKNKKDIKKIDKDIEKIEKDYETRITTSYSEVSSGKTNVINNKMENLIEKKEEKIQELKQRKEKLEAENSILEDKIEDVNIALRALKFKEKTIIYEKYIEGNSYEDIGNRVFWKIFGQTRSANAIQKIAEKAIQKMLKIF